MPVIVMQMSGRRAATSLRAVQLARRRDIPSLVAPRANPIALAPHLLASDIPARTIYALPT
jgi:hypothetical protein